MKIAAIEIEVDGPHNENLAFRPLQRAVRGKFDFGRVGEPMVRIKAADWPLPVPSQRLGIDAEGIGYIAEPLHDDAHAATREKIERQGMKLEPVLLLLGPVDVPTWLFWMKRAVESGVARVVRGKLPENIEGEPRRHFVLNAPGPSAGDKLSAALDRQTAAFEALTVAITKLVATK